VQSRSSPAAPVPLAAPPPDQARQPVTTQFEATPPAARKSPPPRPLSELPAAAVAPFDTVNPHRTASFPTYTPRMADVPNGVSSLCHRPTITVASGPLTLSTRTALSSSRRLVTVCPVAARPPSA